MGAAEVVGGAIAAVLTVILVAVIRRLIDLGERLARLEGRLEERGETRCR